MVFQPDIGLALTLVKGGRPVEKHLHGPASRFLDSVRTRNDGPRAFDFLLSVFGPQFTQATN